MTGELFIRSNQDRDLETFGSQLFDILGTKIEEVRHSDNVAGGQYLVGKVCGLRLRLENAEDAKFNTYDFLLSFEPLIRERGSDSVQLDTFADIVAKYLARQGLTIARPNAFGTLDQTSVEYHPEGAEFTR